MSGRDAFGAVLRRHRRQAGLSQEELAARAFVSTRAISDLERGVNARPRRHTAVALADGLGLEGEERAAFECFARPADEPEEPDEPFPDAPLVPPRTQPPHALDSFVDGGESLAQLVQLVREPRNRLITLVGPGGVGKTRLAVELAHRLDGPVAFVSLASLDEPALLLATIADALGVEHGPRRTHRESLVDHLAPQRVTIVLDNLEQLIAAAGDVAALLRSCPQLTLLVTSRIPLRIAGEVRFPVRPLAASGEGEGGGPAVRLFLERAAAAGFHDVAGTDPPATVAELCARLDGLPLAIELAAARSAVISPAVMLQHLDRALDVLGPGPADAPTHHRSMRAALEWSYRLLPPEGQAAFAAVGVFATSASAEAVMAVWGLAEAELSSFFDLVQLLADAHLVKVEHTDEGEVRLDLFETTRQFARQQLDDEAGLVAYERLSRWAVDLVERAEPELAGADQLVWLDRLDRELPNLRAAGRWLAERGTDEATEAGLRLVSGLQRFWDIRTRWREGVAWLTDALAHPGGPPGPRAKAHKALGVMYRCLGELEAAEVEQGRAVALYGSADDPLGMASCLNNRAVIALDRAEFARARDLLLLALSRFERHGAEWLAAVVLNNLCLATIEVGSLREALRYGRRGIKLATAHGNVAGRSWTEDNVATVLTMAGHPHWAVAIHERVIRQRLALGDRSGLLWSLEALAAAWAGTGDTERAGHLLGFVAAQRERLGVIVVAHLVELTARRRDALIDRIGPARFAELWEEGRALEPEVVHGWFT